MPQETNIIAMIGDPLSHRAIHQKLTIDLDWAQLGKTQGEVASRPVHTCVVTFDWQPCRPQTSVDMQEHAYKAYMEFSGIAKAASQDPERRS